MSSSTQAVPVYAAVELGSDSFRLHVASVEQGAVHILATLNEPIRLGAAIGANGCLGPESMRRSLACLREFRAKLAPWEPRAVRVVATAALRVACNTPAFLAAACASLGHPVEVISGEEEGRLVYLGVAGALGENGEAGEHEGRRLVLDVGSGSTEVAVGRGMQVELVQSFGVGALRQGLAFFGDGISPAAFDAALASSRSRVADAAVLAGARGWTRAYGASGTLRALAELAQPASGPVLGSGDLRALRRALIDEGGLARAAQAWPQPGRAVQLAGGLALLLALVEELGIGELVPVQAGLRAGVIRDLHRREREGIEAGANGARPIRNARDRLYCLSC